MQSVFPQVLQHAVSVSRVLYSFPQMQALMLRAQLQGAWESQGSTKTLCGLTTHDTSEPARYRGQTLSLVSASPGVKDSCQHSIVSQRS